MNPDSTRPALMQTFIHSQMVVETDFWRPTVQRLHACALSRQECRVTLVAASSSGQAAPTRRGIAQNGGRSASGLCLQSNREGADANSMWRHVKPWKRERAL
jgi:hypothetical protein